LTGLAHPQAPPSQLKIRQTATKPVGDAHEAGCATRDHRPASACHPRTWRDANATARVHLDGPREYDLATVGPAPIPPHERHWRHPSELGPTIADVDMDQSGRGLVLTTGVTAALLAAVMVIVLTPPRASAPTAITATTIASVSVRSPNAARFEGAEASRNSGIVRLNQSTMSVDRTLILSGTPNAVSAAPVDQSGNYEYAMRLPERDERVIVFDRSFVYEFSWSEIDRVGAPDGAVVVTLSGELIAVFVAGELELVVR
jgi:hypothetical protein